MAESNTAPTQGVDLSKVINPPIHEHGAFDDLEAHLRFLQLGISALKGLGEMMRPMHAGEMNTTIYSASAVFEFFGEAMEGPARIAYDAMETVQRYAKERAQA